MYLYHKSVQGFDLDQARIVGIQLRVDEVGLWKEETRTGVSGKDMYE